MSDFAPKPTIVSGNPVAGQRLSVAGSAVAFATFNLATNLVIIDVEGSDLYVTFDGTTPSSSNGNQVFAGQSYSWHVSTAQRAKFIQQSTSGTVQANEFVSILGATQMPITDVLKPRPAAAQGLAANSSPTFAGLTVTGGATFGAAIIHKTYLVSALPAASANTNGIVFVSDSTSAPTTGQGTAPSGTGTNVRPVYSNGTSWLQI